MGRLGQVKSGEWKVESLREGGALRAQVRRKKKEVRRTVRPLRGRDVEGRGRGWKPHLRKFCDTFSKGFASLPEVRHLAAPFDQGTPKDGRGVRLLRAGMEGERWGVFGKAGEPPAFLQEEKTKKPAPWGAGGGTQGDQRL